MTAELAFDLDDIRATPPEPVEHLSAESATPRCGNATCGATHSAATDLRVGWPACIRHEPKDPDV